MKFWWICRHWTQRTLKKSNNKQFWGRLHFGKTQNLGSVNTFAGRNNVHSRIIAHKTIWVQWASLFWVYFASTKFAQETLAMQHMPNIGMFERKHHFVKHQGVFFSRIQHIAQQNTWAVSGCRYFFYWQDVSLSIHSQGHLNWRITPLSKQFATPIYQLFRPFGRGTTPVRGLTIQS